MAIDYLKIILHDSLINSVAAHFRALDMEAYRDAFPELIGNHQDQSAIKL